MSFGIANNVKSEVRECTPDLLNAALDSVQVAKVCAELEDALEKCRRGELTRDEPIVLVRPMGIEEVPEVLEEKAATIVGWNANCIIDAIKDAPETM